MLPSHTIKAFFGQTTSLRLYGQQSLQPFTAAIPLGPAIISYHEFLLALGCFLPRIERGVPSPSMERHLRPPLRGGYSRVNKGRKPSDEMFISVFETFHLAGSLDNFISSRILHATALACVRAFQTRQASPFVVHAFHATVRRPSWISTPRFKRSRETKTAEPPHI